jgi:hypothetical protein
MRKISTKMVPRILTRDQKRRFHILQRCLIGPLPVMKRRVFNTTQKQNDRACSGKHRIHLGQKITSRSQVKTMLVCFFDHKGIVHNEFIAQGQMANRQCYLEVMTRLQESVRRISGFSTTTVPLCMMC